jgi:1-phosphofructokinase
MIVTLTPSPSLDLEYQLENLATGTVNRANYFRLRAGGKGVNVSRILVRMGISTSAIVPLNRKADEAFIKSAKSDNIPIEAIDVEVGVRFNATLVHDGKTTKINSSTNPWSKKESKRIADAFSSAAGKSHFAVIGGTFPHSTSSDWIASIVKANSEKTRIVIDSSGGNLSCVLPSKPFLIKPNKDEAEEILGTPIRDLGDAILAAQELRELGPENVLLSLGGLGSILCAHQRVFQATTSDLIVQSTVGAGDALLAGFIGSFNKGPTYALAAGTAWAEAVISNQDSNINLSVLDSTISRLISDGRIVNLKETERSRR